MKGCPSAEYRVINQGGSFHRIWKGYCCVVNRRAENEVFGRAHQQMLGCPRTCRRSRFLQELEVHPVPLNWGLKLGREGDRDWTPVRLRGVLCHEIIFSFSLTGSVFVGDMLKLHMDIVFIFVPVCFESLLFSAHFGNSCIPVRWILFFPFIWHQKIKRKLE